MFTIDKKSVMIALIIFVVILLISAIIYFAFFKSSKEKVVYHNILYLKNDNNICYANSVLQCLLSLPKFTSFIESNDINEITKRLKKIINKQKWNYNDVYNARGLVDLINHSNQVFEIDIEQDASEFLCVLLDKIGTNMFYPKVQTKFIRNECSHFTEKCEYEFGNVYSILNSVSESINISESIDEIYCDVCHEQRSGYKERKIVEHPDYFVVTLERNILANKNKKAIDIDTDLTIGEKCYELKAFIQHKGELNKGHYKAYCERDRWYCFNDDDVKEINIGKYLSKNNKVYMIFYQLKE